VFTRIYLSGVQTCVDAGTLVDEAAFEIRHDGTGEDAPRKGRLARQARQAGLFEGWSFVLPRATDNSPLVGDLDFRDTLVRAGAKVLDGLPPEGVESLVVLYVASAGASMAEMSFSNRTGALLCSDISVLDLISRFESPSVL
jgi:hypothetical protein